MPRQGLSRNGRKENFVYAFGTMINKLKGNPKTIVLTEGTDLRILEAVSRLLMSDFLKPILVGNPAAIKTAAKNAGYNIRDVQIVDPESFDHFGEMVEMFCKIRKSKDMTPEWVKKILPGTDYFGTMLIRMGIGSCLLGSTTYSTTDTICPALQIVKTKSGNKIVSSCFILVCPSATGDNELFAVVDCVINIRLTEGEPAEVRGEIVNCVKIFGIDPKVTFLSYSVVGSGSGEGVDKIRNACVKIKATFLDKAIDGEMRFDATASPTVARTEMRDSKAAGYTNTFIFLDINVDNIGHKIVQRLGGLDAYGPILLGLNAPISDLLRGYDVLEIYSMAAVTVALA